MTRCRTAKAVVTTIYIYAVFAGDWLRGSRDASRDWLSVGRYEGVHAQPQRAARDPGPCAALVRLHVGEVRDHEYSLYLMHIHE